MTNKELQKLMEFIAERQEVFSANMDKLNEAMDKADKRLSRLERGFVALFDLQSETSRIQKDMAEANRELQQAQKHTEEKLNILIDVVERFISENRNGKQANGNKSKRPRK